MLSVTPELIRSIVKSVNTLEISRKYIIAALVDDRRIEGDELTRFMSGEDGYIGGAQIEIDLFEVTADICADAELIFRRLRDYAEE